MSYIVQRNHLFYVVAYNGRDPITGTERRRWHPAGTIRSEAEAMRSRIDADATPRRRKLTLGGFMATTWLDSKMTLTHQTRCRYEWMIDHNIAPRIGQVRIDVLRPVDLDACYRALLDNGGRKRQGLSAKTVLEVHRVISNALDLAVDRRIIETNPEREARPPRRVTRSLVPAIWTAAQLGEFLQRTRTKRLYPALHLVAYTGIRRGELAGLNWGDLDTATKSIAIARTCQVTPMFVNRRHDQGRLRTSRPCPPRIHHAHLPAPPPRNGRRCRQPVRAAHRRHPVDIYRHQPRQTPRQRPATDSAGRPPGRSTNPPENNKGPEFVGIPGLLVGGGGRI